jgi:hypothetical protein
MNGRALKKSTVFTPRPLDVRFWEKVDKRGPDECWPWLGAKNPLGRAKIYVDGMHRSASRISWELHNSQPFPTDLDACHTCDDPGCVNPAHIWAGSAFDNLRDCAAKGRYRGPAGNATLTPEAVREIRARAANGETVLELAKAFAVKRKTIANAIKRATWKSVA